MAQPFSRSFLSAVILCSCLVLAAGCAASQGQLAKALMTDGQPLAHSRDLELRYRLRCPDVLDVRVEGQPDRSGLRSVGPDGRIRLDEQTSVRVAGHTAPEINHTLADRLHLPDQAVQVRVAEYKSQSLYLFSDVDAEQKVVPYRGPETILDLLQRLGGVSSASAPGDIQIVRSHIADGKPPEVFHVNLNAILLRHNLQTNIRLEPFDRIYIGENRRSRLASCVPPLLLPLYRLVCGIPE